MAIGNESWLINVEWSLVMRKYVKNEESVLMVEKVTRNKKQVIMKSMNNGRSLMRTNDCWS